LLAAYTHLAAGVLKQGISPRENSPAAIFWADVLTSLVQTTQAYVNGAEPKWSRQLVALLWKHYGNSQYRPWIQKRKF